MNQDCGMSCAECYRLGNTVADWPRRRECKKLDTCLLSTWENEGGIIPETRQELSDLIEFLVNTEKSEIA